MSSSGTSADTRVGIVGLGEIGMPMAKELSEHGFPVVGFDLDPARSAGAPRQATGVAELGRDSDVVIVAVPGSGPLRRVMDDLLPILGSRHTVIDTGTTLPSTDIELDEACRAVGASFVDAPITLRPARRFLVGGTLRPLARIVLETLGEVLDIGPVGAGQRLKLVNQLLVFGQTAIQSEAVELARRLGMDPRILVDTLNWQISDRVFEPSFVGPDQLTLCRKDIGYVLEVGRAVGARLSLAEAVAAVLEESGTGPMHAMVRYWRV